MQIILSFFSRRPAAEICPREERNAETALFPNSIGMHKRIPVRPVIIFMKIIRGTGGPVSIVFRALL